MTVVNKSWNRLTLPGKIIFTAVPVLIVLAVVAVVGIVLLGGPVAGPAVGQPADRPVRRGGHESCC